MTQRPYTQQLRLSLYREAVAIVEAEYAKDLSVDTIAHRVATSRRQLQRVYAEVGDTTFREHLTEIRMQRAAELLANQRISVREIAGRVGYRQPAHFAKAFYRYHGVNPSVARRRATGPPPRGLASSTP
jgi:AraC family transcriptional regulator of adaptative response / methylphosphotriester-DNA alkyltransferase methyltransferase